MRKKIMMTVLSMVTLLIAVSFTSCGKSAKHTKETTTAVKTEKTTKETKKKEKIEIKILSKYDQEVAFKIPQRNDIKRGLRSRNCSN